MRKVLEKLGQQLLWLNLHRFEALETLDVLDYTPNLISLHLNCQLKKTYDFTKLSQLKELSLWYGKAFSGIFECESIKELTIFKMDAYAAASIVKLHRLETLWIRQTSLKGIDGLHSLSNLNKLCFFLSPKLETIAPIQQCQEITYLYFNCCKGITDWEVIGNMPNLKEICIDNCGILNDINFLKPLENLERVALIGERMKLIDGRVRWLYEKPKMKYIFLPRNKDFDISLEESWAGQMPDRYPDVWKWDLS